MARISLYESFRHWQKDGCIWLFSDPHFGDEDCKLIDRNWPSPQKQVELINNKVGKKDTIVFLGDVGNVDYIKQIKGYKILITGNHDKGVLNYKKQHFLKFNNEWHYYDNYEDCLAVRRYLKADGHSHIEYKNNRLFDEVYTGPLFISSKILLSHEPIKLDFGINIHGHNHSSEHYIYRCNDYVQVNLCADIINYEPKRLDKIVEQFKVKDLHRFTIDKI